MEHLNAITWKDSTTQSSCAGHATSPKVTQSLRLDVSTLIAPTIHKANASFATKKTTTRKRIKTENKHDRGYTDKF